MTQRTLSSIIFLVIFSLATTTALAGGHTAKATTETTGKEIKTSMGADHSETGKNMLPDAHSKAPQGKAHAPQMEELPHIHKFHKERVKKIKKHHSKYWFLSQVILALCHLSILVIGYLHATH